jgi:hypothetical protein
MTQEAFTAMMLFQFGVGPAPKTPVSTEAAPEEKHVSVNAKRKSTKGLASPPKKKRTPTSKKHTGEQGSWTSLVRSHCMHSPVKLKSPSKRDTTVVNCPPHQADMSSVVDIPVIVDGNAEYMRPGDELRLPTKLTALITDFLATASTSHGTAAQVSLVDQLMLSTVVRDATHMPEFSVAERARLEVRAVDAMHEVWKR